MAPTNQIHDFNPGIAPSGLFWTIRVPDESIEVDFEDARASIDLTDVEVADYHDVVNALKHGPSVPSDVSFHIRWSGVKKRVHLRDTQNEYDAHVIEDSATIGWSASREDFKFVSDPANTSTTVYAEIRSERNGEFFPD